jgi:hypothetical protein
LRARLAPSEALAPSRRSCESTAGFEGRGVAGGNGAPAGMAGADALR